MTEPALVAIDHVQLAMPRGREEEARGFYAGLLGLSEGPKPAELAGRGGAWFESGSLKVHLGVDPNFVPAGKAHPAFIVRGLAELERRLAAAGCPLQRDTPLDGLLRLHVNDPFGNRIELIEPL